MLFSNESLFSEPSAVCRGVCSVWRSVCERTMLTSTLTFIHKQKKKDHSVLKLSSVLHGCLHQTDETQKANVGLQKKTSTKGIGASFFVVC